MPTHVRAQADDVAAIVLLPGDPDRAERFAQRHLATPRCYTSYRRLYGFTGDFQGQRVSIQATGMGCPSAAIVAAELCDLGAQTLLRVGTCGALQPELALGDLVIATAACSLNASTSALVGFEGYAPHADFELVRACAELARARSQRAHTGCIGTADLFYDPRVELYEAVKRAGLLALEMEASAIFTIAALRRRRAGCLLTVSDLIASQERMPAEALDAAIDRMLELGLQAVTGLPPRAASR